MDKKLNVCIATRYLLYDPRKFLPPEIEVCSYIANFGHSVTLVTPLHSTGTIEQFNHKKVDVYTNPYKRYIKNNSIFGRAINSMLNGYKAIRLMRNIYEKGKYDLIVVGNEGYTDLVAIYLKKRYKVPVVFMVENPFEQDWEVYRTKPDKYKYLFYLIFKFNTFVELQAIRKSDFVIPIGKWMKAYLAKRGINGQNVESLPQCVDIKACSNICGDDVRQKYGLVNSRVIIYVGTMGNMRNLGLLIHAFSLVVKQKTDVKLLMVGDGDGRCSIEEIVSDLGLEDNVIFTGQVPHSEVPNYIAAADIGVSPVPPMACYLVSSPIKLIEYMAVAKPVIANEEIPEHKEVIENSGGGISVPFTAEAFAGAIVELFDNPEKAVEMGQRGQEWVIQNRSYEFWARQVEENYIRLVETQD